MLSAKARQMLKIPKNAALPGSMGELYDHWFAGRTYRTRFDSWLEPRWIFKARGELESGIYFDCLERYTAQFNFGLDINFRVCVQCANWIPIASSFVALVETDAVLEQSRARKDKSRGLGRFPSQEEFLAKHAESLRGFQDISVDPAFERILQGPASLIVSGRFYTEEPTFHVVEYLF
jgi:hypothetical protein